MSDYSNAAKLLHFLALGAPGVAQMSFTLDQRMAGGDADAATRGRHVFVAGLARAGTTVLMRNIHRSGDFRSLVYRDMPFVLAPNFWARIRGRDAGLVRAAERAHGDGLQVDADSPEGLDEVFWRVFDGRYIEPDRLLPHDPPDHVIALYRAHVAAILRGAGKVRYLAKNNNSILRLPALRRAFPAATILVPFRHPLAQAASLLTQHRRFCDLQGRDRFARRYMGWLVHHEFGLDHRAFATHPSSAEQPSTLAYWLDQWIGVYGWLAERLPEGTFLVCYETLCADPEVWRGLTDRLDLPRGAPAEPLSARAVPEPGADAPPRIAEALRLYRRLRDRAI